MFEIEKTFAFEAGHELVHHDGKCKRPHGHSYLLTVYVAARELQKSGPKKNMVVDFGDIAAVVEPMIEDYLDHHWINDTLGTDSSTAEFIAKWIYDHLKPRLPGLSAIAISETTTAKVTYRP